MNEGRPLNNGEKHNEFPLVRRPSSTVEKAAPGAKLILSGMVTDALELADTQLENWCKKGESYYYGKGVPKNYPEAAKWFHMAGERGHARAQCWLGSFYERARGVPQDYSEAVKWFRKAAEQGYAHGQNALGACYQTGRGIPQDYSEAIMWYRKAAEQENDFAQYNLGVCYRDGIGLPQDYTEAVEWFRKAAEQGNSDAQVAAADEAIKIDPNNALLYYIKGQGLIQSATVDPKTHRIVLSPECTAAYQKYLDLAPTGQFANEVAGILQQAGEKVSSAYKAPKSH